MQKYLAMLTILAAFGAYADPPKSADNKSIEATAAPAPKKRQAITREAKPNEIITDKASYSGIAVQLVKGDNPLQLINPAAPAKYGSPEDNTLRNPIDGKVTGLKIFSIRF